MAMTYGTYHERTAAAKPGRRTIEAATARVRESYHGTGRPSARPPATPPLLFALGRLVATPAALDELQRAAADPVHYIARHATGDWGEVEAEDRAANDRAVRAGERILSAYRLPTGARLWVITEADRTATTLLLPSDY